MQLTPERAERVIRALWKLQAYILFDFKSYEARGSKTMADESAKRRAENLALIQELEVLNK